MATGSCMAIVRVRPCHGEAAEGGCRKRSRAAGSRSLVRDPHRRRDVAGTPIGHYGSPAKRTSQSTVPGVSPESRRKVCCPQPPNEAARPRPPHPFDTGIFGEGPGAGGRHSELSTLNSRRKLLHFTPQAVPWPRHPTKGAFVKLTISVLGLCLMMAVAAPANDPWIDDQVRVERERLADLLASDAIDRIDVVATRFDDAMDRIYTAVDGILAQLEPVLDSPAAAREIATDVILALDDHEVRTSTVIAGTPVFVIIDDADAQLLANVVATATRLVIAHHNGPAPRATAERLFRLIVVETEEPIPPLEQYKNRLLELDNLSYDSLAELLQ